MVEPTGLEIAVTGLAGRFPGASTPEEYWDRLVRGEECIARFASGAVEAETPAPGGGRRVPAFGRLEGIELFDAGLFGMGPREAELMDPQHRILLELAWEALERAAYDPEQLPETPVGVFVGCGPNSYFLRHVLAHAELVESIGGFQTGFGHEKDHLAPLLAYKLGLEGPALTVQCACSSSLAAVHLACQSLLAGECDVALAGGVSVDVSQDEGYVSRGDGYLSREGRCRPFDAAADGMVPGNGAGLVVLRRLAEAVEHGDPVQAVVKGSALGNDGSRRAGYGAPRSDSQARVVRAAQMAAAVDASSLQYLEAHGSSTPLGDSVEVAALTAAFRATTERRGFCALGSVKGNLGHLGAASGIAALIKVVLALRHRTVPPTLHVEEPNPEIDLAASPFNLAREPMKWTADGCPRRAGISSLGFGGTNVHVVLEEAPEPPGPGPGAPGPELLVWSAATPSALEALTDRLAERLEEIPDEDLPDFAYTLRVGRRRLAHRRALVCRARVDAREALTGRNPARILEATAGDLPTAPSAAGPSGGAGDPLERVGRLWLAGDDVSWADLDDGRRRRKLLLPTYPFERRRYWLERPAARSVAAEGPAAGEAPARTVHRRPLDDASFVEPSGELEREIAGIFQELLGIDRVGAEDGFFQLGGNSILGLQVISRIRDTWDVELPLAELFETPTVRALARGVERGRLQGTRRPGGGLLADLDGLSDEDVDTMLAELMAEDGGDGR